MYHISQTVTMIHIRVIQIIPAANLDRKQCRAINVIVMTAQLPINNANVLEALIMIAQKWTGHESTAAR